jgi:hypothetical protein
MPNQFDFYSQQYSGSSWYERILSGSNRVLVLGADGRISASNNIPAEISSVSSSYSVTASHAQFANTLLGSVVSSSYSLTSSYALSASMANTASYVSSSAIYGNVTLADLATSASNSDSASHAEFANTLLGSVTSASYTETSSYANFAGTLLGSIESASYALTSSHAANSTTSTTTVNLVGGYVSATNVTASNISGSGFLSGSSVKIVGLVSAGQLVIFNPGSSPETGSAGVTGEIRYDDDYIYLRTSAGLWKRSPLSLY